jgi:UDP-N-acetylglucosamine--N-acetylmuramyl-(pentapeptide) pyrophosphoryl-undecaprenol N-acetylglucosamine transferase
MINPPPNQVLIAIACGGTGGHLFPGLAVGQRLLNRGARVLLLVSAKDVDQQGVASAQGMEVLTLPGVGLTRGRGLAFVRGLLRSYRAARKRFMWDRPQAALAMGGFTSVAPILAARMAGIPAFLHESNSVTGRANRWLSWVAAQVFIGFPSAAPPLRCSKVTTTGTPVRQQFRPTDPRAARLALGFRPDAPVVVIMGGSQGAAGINELVLNSLPLLAKHAPDLQYFHLSGPAEFETVKAVYRRLNLPAVVHPFFQAMELALGAATLAISRAGASSLAELAAMGVPAILIPYPHAVDNHQLLNARAFARTEAAFLLEQRGATTESLTRAVLSLANSASRREDMRRALAQWHAPRAANQIAQHILETVSSSRPAVISSPSELPAPVERLNTVGGTQSLEPGTTVSQLRKPEPIIPDGGPDASPGPADKDPSNRLQRVMA